ncbi:MAG: FAD binding domain-containing protein [Alphaproteobacteria bacterium]
MKPAPFDYVRAGSLAETHDVLASEGGEAAVLAGGQSLVPLLSMRMARPKVLVDIMHVDELASLRVDGDAIYVGARLRQAELLGWPELAKHQPLLAHALPWVGHWQTRARGTVCGSVALADPSAELPLVLAALGGHVILSSRGAHRRVPADEFFQGIMSTARNDDELIEAVSFPCRRNGEGYAFREFARRHGDFAIVACAAIATEKSVRLAVGGVADRPVVRDFPEVSDEALGDFAAGLEARDDLHATASYRRMLVCKLGAETIAEAQACRA